MIPQIQIKGPCANPKTRVSVGDQLEFEAWYDAQPERIQQIITKIFGWHRDR